MRKGRRTGTAAASPASTQAPPATPDDSERQWLIGLFASFAQERGDLDTLLAFRTDWEMRRRQSWFPGRGLRDGSARRSPGRRLGDLFRRAEPPA